MATRTRKIRVISIADFIKHGKHLKRVCGKNTEFDKTGRLYIIKTNPDDNDENGVVYCDLRFFGYLQGITWAISKKIAEMFNCKAMSPIDNKHTTVVSNTEELIRQHAHFEKETENNETKYFAYRPGTNNEIRTPLTELEYAYGRYLTDQINIKNIDFEMIRKTDRIYA